MIRHQVSHLATTARPQALAPEFIDSILISFVSTR
jgi:hypothetical protein